MFIPVAFGAIPFEVAAGFFCVASNFESGPVSFSLGGDDDARDLLRLYLRNPNFPNKFVSRVDSLVTLTLANGESIVDADVLLD